MFHLDNAELQARLGFSPLIERVHEAMRSWPRAPIRQRLTDPQSREFLVMPAMMGDYAGIKTLTIVPANRGTSHPVISGLFTLFSLATGEALATMDAAELTARRTSAVSAAAADRLARATSTRLVVLGAGHLAPYMAAAIACVRPIREIRFWARNPDDARKAAIRAEQLLECSHSPAIGTTTDLEAAIRSSDIISSATRATSPLVRGEWLSPGTHVDLVGSYRPDMREIDDNGILRARIFVDDVDAVLSESGDIMDPIRRGLLSAEDIAGDLAGLCTDCVGRLSETDITLFKSVGTATVDLIAAIAAWEGRASNR